ncbi:TPA: transposase, partial [Streptococcus pyogenes]
MKLFVGIDVSSQDMKACVMNFEGEALTALTVDNNLTGASYLKDQIVKIAQSNSISEIQIGMEATSVYSWHPAMFFHEDESLKEFKTTVFTINPKLIKKFKESYVDLDKTDQVDAWIIADRLRFGRLPLTAVMQEQFIALQRLTRMRY